MEKFVINIGRQLGSGGREISAELAKRLGISYFDKELLSVAAQESGMSRNSSRRPMSMLHSLLQVDCLVSDSPLAAML